MSTPVKYTKRDLKKICEHPRIEDAILTKKWITDDYNEFNNKNNHLRLNTDRINIIACDKKVYLGKLTVDVGFYNDEVVEYGFLIQLKTNRRRDQAHPNGTDELCLGHFYTPMQKAYLEKDIITLLEYLFMCLETYNPEEAFMSEEEIYNEFK